MPSMAEWNCKKLTVIAFNFDRHKELEVPNEARASLLDATFLPILRVCAIKQNKERKTFRKNRSNRGDSQNGLTFPLSIKGHTLFKSRTLTFLIPPRVHAQQT